MAMTNTKVAKAKAKIIKWRPAFFECGGCGHWHPLGWEGDCRVDWMRFTSDELDAQFPDVNGDGWPDWLEVGEHECGGDLITAGYENGGREEA